MLPKAINAISTEIPMAFLTEIEKNLTICMEPQKTPNSQHNPEKEQSQKQHISWYQIIPQSYRNQNSMVLA